MQNTLRQHLCQYSHDPLDAAVVARAVINGDWRGDPKLLYHARVFMAGGGGPPKKPKKQKKWHEDTGAVRKRITSMLRERVDRITVTFLATKTLLIIDGKVVARLLVRRGKSGQFRLVLLHPTKGQRKNGLLGQLLQRPNENLLTWIKVAVGWAAAWLADHY